MVGHPSSTFSRVFGPDSYRMRRDPGCDPGAIGLVYCDKLSAMYRPSCWRVLLLAPLSCAAFGQPPKLPTTASTVALAADASISASTSGAAAEVLAFERAMEAAVARGDVAYVDRVSASDLSFTPPSPTAATSRKTEPSLPVKPPGSRCGSSAFTRNVTATGCMCRIGRCTVRPSGRTGSR